MHKTILRESTFVSDRSLCVESDKGCVLILASLLEEKLRLLHEAHIEATTYPSKRKVFKDLESVHGPFSTLAGLIGIAFAYGLISEGDYADLEIIRKLRNEAAHSLHDFSLQDSGAQNLVKALHADARYGDANGTKGPPCAESNARFPRFTEARRLLLLSGLVLDDGLRRKLCQAVEALLAKRRTGKTGHKPS